MKPVKLTMSAFGPYAHKQVLDFTCLGNHTLFLICGPTGAGKSTILDAMCYALYGRTSGDVRTGENMAKSITMESLAEVPLPHGRFTAVRDQYLEYSFAGKKAVL